MRTPLVLVLVALLAPAAHAQLPTTPQGCGPIHVIAPVPPEQLEPGAQGSIQVTVENRGTRAADITVAADTTSDGWSFESAQSQSAPGIAAGASTTFSFTVSPAEGAELVGIFNFATTAACPAGPLGCPSGSSVCTAQGQPQTVSVATSGASGFRIPGLDALGLPLPYVAAGLLLVGLAIAVPLVLRKRKPERATATCPEPMKPVKPGKGASFPIEVKNPSQVSRKLHLEVGSVPEGWSAFLPLPEIQLASRETRSLWLMVRAPPEARPGQFADVEVTATDAGRPERPTVVRVRAEVEAESG